MSDKPDTSRENVEAVARGYDAQGIEYDAALLRALLAERDAAFAAGEAAGMAKARELVKEAVPEYGNAVEPAHYAQGNNEARAAALRALGETE